VLNRDCLGETKCKVQTCVGKVMVSVVCDSAGTLLVEFLERFATISLDHTASHTVEDNLLPNFRREIKLHSRFVGLFFDNQ